MFTIEEFRTLNVGDVVELIPPAGVNWIPYCSYVTVTQAPIHRGAGWVDVRMEYISGHLNQVETTSHYMIYRQNVARIVRRAEESNDE